VALGAGWLAVDPSKEREAKQKMRGERTKRQSKTSPANSESTDVIKENLVTFASDLNPLIFNLNSFSRPPPNV
jgi:hypothetical protein